MGKPAAKRPNVGRIDLKVDLALVNQARVVDLRDIWRDRLGSEPPAIRAREVLRRMLAYRLQEAVHGGLPAALQRKLDKIEDRRQAGPTHPRAPVTLSLGMILSRDWKGVQHEVHVGVDGFVHSGQTYKSLSEVARAITGSRWNGPLFFGLRDKLKAVA